MSNKIAKLQKLFHTSQEKDLLLPKIFVVQAIFLKQVDSTNAFMLEMVEDERVGKVVWAASQTAGKGMATNVWESAPGLNLTFSMGLDLSFMKAADQFLLSQAVPLGLLDVLDVLLPPAPLKLKWPNDLYFDHRKLCGILINSTIHGLDMGVSVVGVGLNVNQTQFQDWPTNPISMKMILNHEIELESLLAQLVVAIEKRVHQLKTDEGIITIKNEYLKRLYRYHTWAEYEVSGTKVRRYIIGIDPFGRLQTLDESSVPHTYDLKEIRFL